MFCGHVSHLVSWSKPFAKIELLSFGETAERDAKQAPGGGSVFLNSEPVYDVYLCWLNECNGKEASVLPTIYLSMVFGRSRNKNPFS